MVSVVSSVSPLYCQNRNVYTPLDGTTDVTGASILERTWRHGSFVIRCAKITVVIDCPDVEVLKPANLQQGSGISHTTEKVIVLPSKIAPFIIVALTAFGSRSFSLESVRHPMKERNVESIMSVILTFHLRQI